MARMSDRARQGIFARLIEDHRQVTAMMEQIEATADDSAFDTDSLFEELRKEILVHSLAEDEVVYDALARYRSTAHMIRIAREQHGLVEYVLTDLDRVPADDPRWKAKFQVLEDLIEHHIDEEENDLFELAADVLDRGQSDELVEDFEDARVRAEARLPRRAPAMPRSYDEEARR
jgi:hemerythrin-like domain-containing protein